jgi:hypothetical protein
VPRVEVDTPYTGSQLRELIDQSTAKELELQGYVLQYDVLSRTYRVVHYTKASAPLNDSGKIMRQTAMFDPLPPIQKRTPADRVDSLMLKWIDDMKRAGTIPGVDEEKVKEIVGAAFVAGRTEITAEVVRQVAAHFLQDAENKAKT